MLDKSSIAECLKIIGIEEGDTILVRGSLNRIGKVERPAKKTIIDALLASVGKSGTIVTLGFTKSYPFYNVDRQYIFSKNTQSNSGALSSAFLSHPDCKRSRHPTNSFLAIGNNSNYILDGHDESSLSYDPIGKLIELNSKMILIGCVEDSPGFTTVHYAQQELGLTSKSYLKGLLRVYYQDINKSKLFIRKDLGGCSSGFSIFYDHYKNESILKDGWVGNAYSIMVPAKRAYEVEYNLIKNNPKLPLCGNPDCFICRATWSYNKSDIVPYIIRKLRKAIMKTNQ